MYMTDKYEKMGMEDWMMWKQTEGDCNGITMHSAGIMS